MLDRLSNASRRERRSGSVEVPNSTVLFVYAYVIRCHEVAVVTIRTANGTASKI